MTAMETVREGDAQRLHAYHDGELGRFARWRFARRLERSPALRRELRELDWLGDLARESDARAFEPDLWEEIALRLPAEEARRAEESEKSRSSFWWMGPAGAVVAAGLVALALAFGDLSGDTSRGAGVVRWMDGGPRSVLVLEEESATIIWMLDEPSADEAAAGGAREVV